MSLMEVERESIGTCPVCERQMWKGVFVDRHHFKPKMYGGKESEWVHKVCHNKIHSVFTEKELAKEYYDPEKVRSHPEMQKFIEWIQRKDPDYYDKNVKHNRKRKK